MTPGRQHAPTAWRLVHGTGRGAEIDAAPGALNMAVDHALLESVQRGAPPVLRLYRWLPACLSFGRNQHARDIYDPDAIRNAGLDVVRRPTGGLAVLHDHELTYCVLAPLDLLGGPRRSYHAINRALVAGLASLGVPAALSAAGARRDPRRMSADPCFQSPAEGEVTAAGGKLVGSAQRCEGGALLQHGSILLSGSQARVADLVRASGAVSADTPADADGSVTLERVLGAAPDAADVARAIVSGFDRTLGTRLAPGGIDGAEAGSADRLRSFYADDAWTWRL